MKSKRSAQRRMDFFILLFVLSLTVTATLGVRALLYGKKEDTPPARIVIRVEGVEQSLTEGIASGERVIDRTHRRLLGTVSEIRRTPQVTEIAPTSGEETVLCERVGLVDLDLVLIPDHDHSGYFVTPRVWSVGTTLTFATPSFAATGTIIRVER